ncbi:hypothetical protein ACOSQ3_003022 [Xanthoceras sorbifolium]
MTDITTINYQDVNKYRLVTGGLKSCNVGDSERQCENGGRETKPETAAHISPYFCRHLPFTITTETSRSVACSGTLSDHLRKLKECCIEVDEKICKTLNQSRSLLLLALKVPIFFRNSLLGEVGLRRKSNKTWLKDFEFPWVVNTVGAFFIVKGVSFKYVYENFGRSSEGDGVISAEILSLLDAKEAVRTCVLSQAWRVLWNNINILSFDLYSFRPEKSDAFENFIYHVLKHRQPSEVRRLRFYYRGFVSDSSAIISNVFDYATSHKVTEVETDVTCFPKSLLESQTLKILKVACGGYSTLENPLDFKFLTTLQVSEVSMSKCSDFFSNCKNLKNLELTNCNVGNLKTNSNTFCIKAPSLVNLIIKNLKHRDGKFIKSLETLQISSPRLKYFELNGLLPYLPNVLNMCECKALEEVKFNMRDPLVSRGNCDPEWKIEYIDYMKWIAERFPHVKCLTMSIDFYWGNFILWRDGLTEEVKLEEIYKECNFYGF